MLLECAEGLGEHRGPEVPHTDWGWGMWGFPKNASSPKWQSSVCWRVSRKWARGWSSQLSSQKKKKKNVWRSLVCTGKIADSQTASSVCPPSVALWSVTLQTQDFILCTLYIFSNLLGVSSFQPVFSVFQVNLYIDKRTLFFLSNTFKINHVKIVLKKKSLTFHIP